MPCGPTSELAARETFRHEPVAGAAIVQGSDHGSCAVYKDENRSITRVLFQCVATLRNKAVNSLPEIRRRNPKQDRAFMSQQYHQQLLVLVPSLAAA